MKSIAVMQPYFLPYIGYFQLIAAVDRFVLFDDVQFIKRGWVHRNRILLNGEAHLFTLPVKNAPQRAQINEVELVGDVVRVSKILKMIGQSYKDAPYFQEVYPVVESIFLNSTNHLVEFIIYSLQVMMQLLDIQTELICSSAHFHNQHLHAEPRILDICKLERAGRYVNLPGGIDLYNKTNFSAQEIQLEFIKPQLNSYLQKHNLGKKGTVSEFVPGLSIIDVMMYNPISEIKKMLLQRDFI
ncbi:WbqC family protein [Undibacterium sp. LX40W]|uniref:WbqC family protein n=1 Tax=Undibacterium nitidum TaxID=2762298 RepID=A0A923KRJ8_9BURK|nr:MULTISPECIES: WbqC family protein [Undibacterium]MBC3880291.1 WbqC family protein [Undibacterium nitidum]MBC3890973.1 WbqC family protein [Undibacterium sp. LX40W]